MDYADLAQYSRFYGELLAESDILYDESHYYASVLILFNLLEQMSKLAVDDFDSNSVKVYNKLKIDNIINAREYEMLSNADNSIRKLRNKLVHEQTESLFIEKDGILYSLMDGEGFKLIYETYRQFIGEVVLKIIKDKQE